MDEARDTFQLNTLRIQIGIYLSLSNAEPDVKLILIDFPPTSVYFLHYPGNGIAQLKLEIYFRSYEYKERHSLFSLG
jgi:hypothetical protein